jgi:hypothetical protein
MKRRRYEVGDWFAVPLGTCGYAIVVVAKKSWIRGVLLGYFFGPRRAAVPDLSCTRDLRAENAVLVHRFGHLGIQDRTWTPLPGEKQLLHLVWPMPNFVSHDPLTGRWRRRSYAAEDPGDYVREEIIDAETASKLPEVGLAGSGYIEAVLDRLLPPISIGQE